MRTNRRFAAPLALAGVACVAASSVLAVRDSGAAHAAETEQSVAVASVSERASTEMSRTLEEARVSVGLVMRGPRLLDYLETPGGLNAVLNSPTAKITHTHDDVVRLLSGLFAVHRNLVANVTLMDTEGRQFLRIDNGSVATQSELRAAKPLDKFGGAPSPLVFGQVYTSGPTTSWLPATHSGTVVRTAGTVSTLDKQVVGYLVVEMPTQAMTDRLLSALGRTTGDVRVIDARKGRVQLRADSENSTTFNNVGSVDPVFAVADTQASAAGEVVINGRRSSFAPVSFLTSVLGPIDWAAYVVSSQPAVDTGWDSLSPVMILLFALGVAFILGALIFAVRRARANKASRHAAMAARDDMRARLDEMSLALGRVAGGDLGVRLPVESFDDEELHGMAASFDSTLARLRDLVAQVQDQGTTLAQASVELQAASGQQASAAEQQASGVAETTATIEELAATAGQIATTSEQVSRVATDTLALTEEGRQAVAASVDAMQVVGARVDAIGERAVSLGDTGREIGRILDVIDELAERTNLLALNAAIEAARAGEHGRGFAVVAAEIRKLAERAKTSTGEIQGLVARIAHESGQTVMASEEGTHEVRRAQGVADEAVRSLDRIAEMVDETTTATREISIATQQQRSASHQVVAAMESVSEVSRQYAVGSQQALSAAVELALLAEQMRDAVSTFNVDITDWSETEGHDGTDDQHSDGEDARDRDNADGRLTDGHDHEHAAGDIDGGPDDGDGQSELTPNDLVAASGR